MPTLNIKLNQYQKNIIASNHNLLCLGRSGTGKTTTSILRLFAQEVLYAILKKHQENLEREKRAKALEEAKMQQMPPNSVLGVVEEVKEKGPVQSKKVNLLASDLEKTTGIKMVFITASPVLTTEVKRFYSSIKKKLINHLKKREDACAQASSQEAFQHISEQEANELIEKAVAE